MNTSALIRLTALSLFSIVGLVDTPAAVGNDTPSSLVTVQLQLQATVARPLVTIADVAIVTGGEAALRERILALDLDDLGLAHRPMEIPRNRLMIRMQLAGINPTQVRLLGPNSIVVQYQPRPLNDADVTDAIAQTLSEHWQLPRESVEVRLLQPLDESLATDKSLAGNVQLRPILTGDVHPGRLRLTMGVYQQDQLLQTFALSVAVQVTRAVAIASRPIVTGDRLTSSNVRLVTQSLTGRQALNFATSQAIGSFATRAIRTGQPIEQQLVSPDPTVAASNDGAEQKIKVPGRTKVSVVARRRNLTFTLSDAELTRQSTVGEIVTVTNPKSKRVIRGRLVSPSEVEVDY